MTYSLFIHSKEALEHIIFIGCLNNTSNYEIFRAIISDKHELLC